MEDIAMRDITDKLDESMEMLEGKKLMKSTVPRVKTAYARYRTGKDLQAKMYGVVSLVLLNIATVLNIYEETTGDARQIAAMAMKSISEDVIGDDDLNLLYESLKAEDNEIEKLMKQADNLSSGVF